MESVLAGLARGTCTDYMDDILVMGKSFREHMDNLRAVFSRLREAGLRLKPSKCQFARPKVEYLGYVVSSKGISADPKKLETSKFLRIFELSAHSLDSPRTTGDSFQISRLSQAPYMP